MGLTRKGKFERDYENRSEIHDVRYIVVAVKLITGSVEIITNSILLDKKLEYYMTAYDKDLKLKTNPHIQIINWMIV